MEQNYDLSTREKWIILALSLGTILVHFVNLGIPPLLADESIRGAVAFEMMQREDYIVPTIWGEYYYRKPPFYNWILIGFFELTGSFSRYVLRLPSVIPLMLFGGAIWAVARKAVGQRAAVYAAFAFVLSGRLLTRDSMLGHIDILYSLFTFLEFYAIYYFWKRKQWWALFLVSYILAACGVLMKGMPSFLFQAFTLVAWFAWKRDFKRLFSLPNITGVAVFAAIVGGYFWLYSHTNSLEDYFGELWNQSSQRTVIDKKWYEGILNIFTFPFENFGHLFPTSLLLVYIFRRGIIRQWLKQDFTAFTFITLAINVVPYWLSPGYYPRYLFMLYPLLFILGCEAYVTYAEHRPKLKRVIEVVMLVIGCVLIPAFVVVPFVPFIQDLWHVWWSAGLLFLTSVALVVLWFRAAPYRTWLFFAFIIVFRMGFDLYVIPYRIHEGDRYLDRQIHSENILEITKGHELKVLWKTPLFIDYAYYLGTGTGDVMAKDPLPRPGVFYVAEEKYIQEHDFERFYEFELGYRDYTIFLVKLRETSVDSTEVSTP